MSVFPESMHMAWVVVQVDFPHIFMLPALILSLCHEQFYGECLTQEFRSPMGPMDYAEIISCHVSESQGHTAAMQDNPRCAETPGWC